MAFKSNTTTEQSTALPSRKPSKLSIESNSVKQCEQMIRNASGVIDIFEMFTKVTRRAEISIPETLLKLPGADPIYLFSHRNYIEVYRKNAISDFFSYVSVASGSPHFIHFSEEGVKVSYNTKEALRCWGSCKAQKQMLQRYVMSPNRVPAKIRVLWMAKQQIKCFYVRNNLAVPKGNMKRYSISEKNVKYQHSLNDYPYAGQIFKSSFNSFMPEKSCIQDFKRSYSKKQTIGEYQKALYTVKFSNEKAATKIIDSNESIASMVEEFIQLFNNHLHRTDKRVLSEVLLDFIQDEEYKWYMTKCKAYTIDYLPTKIILNPLMSPHLLKKSLITTDFVKTFYNSIKDKAYENKNRISLSPSNLIQRLNKVESKSNDFSSKRPVFIDIKEITEANICQYLYNKPDFLYPMERRRPQEIEYLNVAVKKLDEFRMHTRSSLK